MNALEAMEIERVNEEVQEYTGFRIENLEAANWALRKISALQKKQVEIDQLAQAEISRIQEWQKSEEEKNKYSIQFFEGLLTDYFVRQREQDPKFKISTPYGKVAARKQQPKWEYTDEKKAIECLKSAGLEELVRIKEELDKAALKKTVLVTEGKAITGDGEVIEGITILDLPEKIDIKVV